jgi:LysR family nod box-dependent transcriptional activator
MHFKGLDLNLAVALDALLTHRNVTRAGQSLHLSQSAMSGALGRLREHFDDPLLVRVGGEFRLTAIGQTLKDRVGSLMAQMESVFNTRPVFDPTLATRDFLIMSSPYQSIVLLSHVIRKIEKYAPGIHFRIVPFSDAPEKSLEQGSLDLLMIAEEAASDKHPYEVLLSDDFVCVCCASRKDIGDSLTETQFRELGHIVVRYGSVGSPYRDEAFLRDLGVERRIELVVNSFCELTHHLVESRKIATMPRSLAHEFARSFPLRILPLPTPMPQIRKVMQWHSYKSDDPGLTWLREQIAETALILASSSMHTSSVAASAVNAADTHHPPNGQGPTPASICRLRLPAYVRPAGTL